MIRTKFRVFLTAVLMLLLPASAFAVRAGDLDKTFNAPKGYAMKNIGIGSSQAHGTAIQKDGKIVVIGDGQGMEPVIYVLRYNTDGTLDTSFGNNGTKTLSGRDGRALVIQSDGKIVVAGSIGDWNSSDLLVMRLNVDGSIDRSFGTDGVVTCDNGIDERANAIALQPDGKLVVAGYTLKKYPSVEYDVVVLRLADNGLLDKSFGGSGVVTFDGGSLDMASGIAVQPNGKIVVVGTIWFSNDHLVTGIDALILRYNGNGSLDTTFGNDGVVIYDGSGHYFDFASSVAIQPDGKILVAGGTSELTNYAYSLMVLRYNKNGTSG